MLTTANYFFSNKQAVIDYNHHSPSYNYKRTFYDVVISFSPEYNGRHIEAKLIVSNNMYASNTSNSNRYFLPGIFGFTRFHYLFDNDEVSIKLSGSVSRFISELPIDKSLAYSNQTQIPVGKAQQYLPVTEVETYNNLYQIRHQEYTGGV